MTYTKNRPGHVAAAESFVPWDLDFVAALGKRTEADRHAGISLAAVFDEDIAAFDSWVQLG